MLAVQHPAGEGVTGYAVEDADETGTERSGRLRA